MNKFVDNVRTSKIPNPTSRKFTLKKWENNFTSIGNPSEKDQRLFTSGIWIYENLKRIRDILAEETFFDVMPKEDSIKLFCNWVNLLIQQARQATRLANTSHSFTMGQVVQAKFGQGKESNPPTDTIVESIIDGLRFPLSELCSKSPTSSNVGSSSQPEVILRKVNIILNLGRYYSWLLETWNHCVWMDWYVDITEKYDIVRQVDTEMEKIHAISFFRYRLFSPENLILFIELWNSADEMEKNVSVEFLK